MTDQTWAPTAPDTAATPPGPTTTDTAPYAGRPRHRVGGVLHRYGLVGVFLLVIVIFSVLRPGTFPTAANASTIAATSAVVALLALGAMLPLTVGHFDISFGFQMGLSQALCAGLMIRQELSPVLAIALAMGSGVVVGLVNALLVVKLQLNSMVATLGVGILVLGFTQMYSDGATIIGEFPPLFVAMGRSTLFGVPLPLIIVLIVTAVIWFGLEYTATGRSWYATGANARAALLAGVRTDRAVIQAFVLCGLLAGAAGCLSVAILGASSPTVGLGELLPAMAGAFLGATAIRPGRFNAIGTTLAVYMLATGVVGLQQLGAAFYVQQLFNGAALLLAVILSAAGGRRSTST